MSCYRRRKEDIYDVGNVRESYLEVKWSWVSWKEASIIVDSNIKSLETIYMGKMQIIIINTRVNGRMKHDDSCLINVTSYENWRWRSIILKFSISLVVLHKKFIQSRLLNFNQASATERKRKFNRWNMLNDRIMGFD